MFFQARPRPFSGLLIVQFSTRRDVREMFPEIERCNATQARPKKPGSSKLVNLTPYTRSSYPILFVLMVLHASMSWLILTLSFVSFPVLAFEISEEVCESCTAASGSKLMQLQHARLEHHGAPKEAMLQIIEEEFEDIDDVTGSIDVDALFFDEEAFLNLG